MEVLCHFVSLLILCSIPFWGRMDSYIVSRREERRMEKTAVRIEHTFKMEDLVDKDLEREIDSFACNSRPVLMEFLKPEIDYITKGDKNTLRWFEGSFGFSVNITMMLKCLLMSRMGKLPETAFTFGLSPLSQGAIPGSPDMWFAGITSRFINCLAGNIRKTTGLSLHFGRPGYDPTRINYVLETFRELHPLITERYFCNETQSPVELEGVKRITAEEYAALKAACEARTNEQCRREEWNYQMEYHAA